MENEIGIGLSLALASFPVAWIIHLIIWRIRRPEAYPYWIPAIFFGAFILVSISIGSYFNYRLLGADLLGLLSGFLLQFLLTVGYIMGYAGIIEYSPSVEVLLEVKKHMPSGLPEEALNVTSLSEEILTVKRIRHLLAAGMIRENDGWYEVTPQGRAVVGFTIFIRRLLFLPPFGKG